MNHDRLLKTLRLLERLYSRLNLVAQAKRSALIEFAVHDIERIIEQEGELIARIARVEKVREEELAQWLPTTDNPTLGDLIAQDPSDELIELRDRLRVLACELARVNRLNSELCAQGLEHLQGFIDVITRGNVESSTYGRSGSAKRYSPRPLVNRSI